MADLRPINPATHAGQGFAPSPDFLHSRKLDRVPLLIAEVPVALMLYPMGFSRIDGRLQLVAILGCRAGQNDCLGEGGRWRTGYVPSHLRAWPFALIPDGGGNGGQVLGFDHDSGLWRPDPDPARGEMRAFDPDGQPSAALQRAGDFLRQRASNQIITDMAVAELDKAGVLTPWRFADAISGGEPPQDLLRINQKALHALAPDILARLLAANALALAHAQLFSMPRLSILARLQEQDSARGTAEASGFFAGDEGDLDFSFDN